MINCKIELDLLWSINCVISEISRTIALAANPPNPARAEVETTNPKFQTNIGKHYVPVVTLFINDNIKFLENIKQEFKRVICWNNYRSEVTKKNKKNPNNLEHIIDPTFRNINSMFVLSFKNGDNDLKRDSFDMYICDIGA